MSVVSDYKKVKEIYQKAAEKGWVIPCICSENLTTTEAIFSAAEDFAVSDRKSTRLNSSHNNQSRMPSSA